MTVIYCLPSLLVFHWGLDTFQRNPRNGTARLLAAQHFTFLLMLFAIFAIQVLPVRDAPGIAIEGIGSLGVLLAAFGVHVLLRVLGWMDRWPRGVGLGLAYLWTIPGLWTIGTGHNLVNVTAFVRRGFWTVPLYNGSFHLAMAVAVLITGLLALGLGWSVWHQRDARRRGQMAGLRRGALYLTAADLFLGALLPRITPAWLPPYPYLVGFLLWLVAVRRTMTRYDFVPSRLQQYRNLFTGNPSPLLVVDRAGHIVEMNPAGQMLVGPTRDSLGALLPAAEADTWPRRWVVLASGQPLTGWDVEVVDARGIGRPLTIDGAAVMGDDRSYGVLVLHDTSVAQREQAKLSRLAYHDALTGLPNALQFTECLEALLAEPGTGEAGFAVCVVDLDNFKDLNDAAGHVAGNEALVEVARRLSRDRRPDDVVSRWGGDEFLVLLTDCGTAEAAQGAADRLAADVRQPLPRIGPRGFSLTVSIGVSLYPVHGRDAETLVRAADAAM
ncbi:MAG: diguanylate cyclase domain-containing protein [Clostridia bacterium]